MKEDKDCQIVLQERERFITSINETLQDLFLTKKKLKIKFYKKQKKQRDNTPTCDLSCILVISCEQSNEGIPSLPFLITAPFMVLCGLIFKKKQIRITQEIYDLRQYKLLFIIIITIMACPGNFKPPF